MYVAIIYSVMRQEPLDFKNRFMRDFEEGGSEERRGGEQASEASSSVVVTRLELA